MCRQSAIAPAGPSGLAAAVTNALSCRVGGAFPVRDRLAATSAGWQSGASHAACCACVSARTVGVWPSRPDRRLHRGSRARALCRCRPAKNGRGDRAPLASASRARRAARASAACSRASRTRCPAGWPSALAGTVPGVRSHLRRRPASRLRGGVGRRLVALGPAPGPGRPRGVSRELTDGRQARLPMLQIPVVGSR